MGLDISEISAARRLRSVDVANRRLLVADFRNSAQKKDLTDPPNCGGFGRIRHFYRSTGNGWPDNPLPLDPACKALQLPRTEMLRSQVFQFAACNISCWYCFVPPELRCAAESHAAWLTPTQLVEAYCAEPDRPCTIDLTGGEPSLVPEWVPWMMADLQRRDLDRQVYLWSDNNLTNDLYWEVLSDEQRQLMASYRNYGRVCCFKGMDARSFAFNTSADEAVFDAQFTRFGRLLSEGLDLYAYVTLTTPTADGIRPAMKQFIDRLQSIHPNLPLRTVPLEVRLYSAVEGRVNAVRRDAIRHQWSAVEEWTRELESRFSLRDRSTNIADVRLGE